MTNSNDLFLDMVEFKAKYAYLADKVRELRVQMSVYEDDSIVSNYKRMIAENSIAELKAIINKYDV